ncbi:M20/M25/M40 family metallo-hydrolase [Thalassotalea aquiviva]|uniref:M20/M25/M40 family metallo-hydrolase n=1 Tax=Thalassotalea aquiviva TaxID=3242415 RepID=UPI003529DE8C
MTIKRKIVCLFSSLIWCSNAFANINKDQLIDDLTFLASDELNGRQTFSAEIDQAANYINDRFKHIGLTPFNQLTDFKQTFELTDIAPTSISVKLNGREIGSKDIAFAATQASVNWQSVDDITVSVIGADTNFRDALFNANAMGGQQLLLVHPAHAPFFSRIQDFLAEGIRTQNANDDAAMVLILTSETKLETFNIQGTTTKQQRKLTNVIGVLPGKSKPNEVVIYSAHYDHLGLNPGGEGDVIFNGADDDASGTAAVINLAEYFTKQNNNERTLMFVAFTAEEIGGYGSKYFSEQLDPNSIVAMINIEMIGKPSKFGAGTIWMTGPDKSDLRTLLNAQLKDKNIEIYPDPYPEQKLFYRSDNATLARLGVPAHSFSSTQLDKDKYYHSVSDDISSLDLDSFHLVVEQLATSTLGLSNGSITPRRVDPANIRPTGKIF